MGAKARVVKARVVHWIPGRVRLSFAEKRGDADYFKSLFKRFSAIDEIQRIKVNPVAGSVLLEFTGTFEQVMKAAQIDAEVSCARDISFRAPSMPSMPSMSSMPAMRPLRPPVNLVTGREIDGVFMSGTLFAAIALLQSLRGRVMVPAVTAFWYATNAFHQSGHVMDITENIAEGD